MDAIGREEFREAIRVVREDIRGVHDRLDLLNGRVRENDQAIARTDTTVALIKQRVDQAAHSTSAGRRWIGHVTSGAAAAAGALLLERLFQGVFR